MKLFLRSLDMQEFYTYNIVKGTKVIAAGVGIGCRLTGVCPLGERDVRTNRAPSDFMGDGRGVEERGISAKQEFLFSGLPAARIPKRSQVSR